jgi:hypothetical protein
MKQASPVKFYFAKYFFLVLGLLQAAIGALILYRQAPIPKNQFTAFICITLGLIFVSLFFLLSSKMRQVAIGKNKIIIRGRRELKVDWPEVKSIRNIPFFNVYSLKIKGHKDQIFFLPEESTTPLFGIFSSPDIKKIKSKD